MTVPPFSFVRISEISVSAEGSIDAHKGLICAMTAKRNSSSTSEGYFL